MCGWFLEAKGKSKTLGIVFGRKFVERRETERKHIDVRGMKSRGFCCCHPRWRWLVNFLLFTNNMFMVSSLVKFSPLGDKISTCLKCGLVCSSCCPHYWVDS